MEDSRLASAVEALGPQRWAQVAVRVPGRTDKQCRERWFNHLCPEVKKGDWTVDEDRTIIESVAELGTSWCRIVRRLPGRTDHAVKNRYNALVRRQNKSVAEQMLQTMKPEGGGDGCGAGAEPGGRPWDGAGAPAAQAAGELSAPPGAAIEDPRAGRVDAAPQSAPPLPLEAMAPDGAFPPAFPVGAGPGPPLQRINTFPGHGNDWSRLYLTAWGDQNRLEAPRTYSMQPVFGRAPAACHPAFAGMPQGLATAYGAPPRPPVPVPHGMRPEHLPPPLGNALLLDATRWLMAQDAPAVPQSEGPGAGFAGPPRCAPGPMVEGAPVAPPPAVSQPGTDTQSGSLAPAPARSPGPRLSAEVRRRVVKLAGKIVLCQTLEALDSQRDELVDSVVHELVSTARDGITEEMAPADSLGPDPAQIPPGMVQAAVGGRGYSPALGGRRGLDEAMLRTLAAFAESNGGAGDPVHARMLAALHAADSLPKMLAEHFSALSPGGDRPQPSPGYGTTSGMTPPEDMNNRLIDSWLAMHESNMHNGDGPHQG